MCKLAVFAFCIFIVMGLFLSGCRKQHPVIAIPPSVESTNEASIPNETIVPTPDMPSQTPEVSLMPTPSSSPSPSNPATSTKPSATIPSVEKSTSKAPAKASNSIKLSNSKGSVSLQLGAHAQTVLPAYGALSNMQPTQESIDWVADFPENKIDEFSDGYYRGPAPGATLTMKL